MYTNAFVGMEFTDDQRGVVFHFANDDALADEFIFETGKEATQFYFDCLGFCEHIEDYPVEVQENLFRKFLDYNVFGKNHARVKH